MLSLEGTSTSFLIDKLLFQFVLKKDLVVKKLKNIRFIKKTFF